MAKYDAGSALSGAGTGASVGSLFGPVGTGIGAIAGGALGLFGSKKKKKKKPKQISSLDPQQQGLYTDYVNSLRGEGPFNDMYNYDVNAANANFDANVSRPAYRNYQENIIPNITGQFRQKNIGNSSYTGEALARSGRDVQENLDALRSNTIFQGQQNAGNNKQNAINNILGMQTFAYQKPQERKPSMIDQILGKTAPAAGEWFADYLKSDSGGGAKTNNSGAMNTFASLFQ